MAEKSIEIVFEREQGAATVLGRTVLWQDPESEHPTPVAEVVFDRWQERKESKSVQLESGLYMAVTLVDVQENLNGLYGFTVKAAGTGTVLAQRKGDVNTTSQKVGEIGRFRHARLLRV